MSSNIGVDIGGTFADFVAVEPATGAVSHTKALREADLGELTVSALGRMEVDAASVGLLMHATTLVTNLIIERDGAAVGLITTEGFRDVLEIGWSYRDDAYDPQWDKPIPIVPRLLRREVRQRTSADGRSLTELDEEGVRQVLQSLADHPVDVLAVSLLHSYADPGDERRIRELAAEVMPAVPCILSSDVDPRMGEFERTSSTVLSAYARPRVEHYIDELHGWLPSTARSLFMHSGGGVIPPSVARENPVTLVASGPVAGVLAACHLGQLSGHRNLISFDVGGTSTDVCVIQDGKPTLTDMIEIEPGIPLRTQCVKVVSVGAGGGSIAWIDEGETLRVGPHSAGASPGPACYGHGGTNATVTDANVVLGLVDAEGLLGGELQGDSSAARTAVEGLAGPLGLTTEVVAAGIFHIANANMAQAIRNITVQNGLDPREFSLMAFGGAGGQHAVEVAREMQIPEVIFPPMASTFSALGLLTADLKATRVRPAMRLLADLVEADVTTSFSEMVDELRDVLGAEASQAADACTFQRFLDLRYLGQVHAVTVDIGDEWDVEQTTGSFEDAHEALFGTRLGDPIEVVNYGMAGTLELVTPELFPALSAHTGSLEPDRHADLEVEGKVPVFVRAALGAEAVLPTPCLVTDRDSVIYLPADCTARTDQFGSIVCQVQG